MRGPPLEIYKSEGDAAHSYRRVLGIPVLA